MSTCVGSGLRSPLAKVNCEVFGITETGIISRLCLFLFYLFFSVYRLCIFRVFSMSDSKKPHGKASRIGQLPEGHVDWISDMLNKGFSVRYITFDFLEEYPGYLEQGELDGFDRDQIIESVKYVVRKIGKGLNLKSKKIIENDFSDEEIDYLCKRVAAGLSKKEIAERFLEKYPKYVSKAEAKGYAKTSVLKIVKRRVKGLRDSRRKTRSRIDDLTQNVPIDVLRKEFAETVTPEDLRHFTKIMRDILHRVSAGEVIMPEEGYSTKLAGYAKKLNDDLYYKYAKEMRTLVKDALLQKVNKEDAQNPTNTVQPKKEIGGSGMTGQFHQNDPEKVTDAEKEKRRKNEQKRLLEWEASRKTDAEN